MIIDGKSVALIAAGLTAVMGGIGSAWGVVWQESQLAQCYRRSQIFLDRCLCFRLCQVRRVLCFIAMFLALGRINAATSISIAQALQLIGALLPAMFGELISAYWQAVASCGAAQMVAKQPESFGRAVIIPALVETYAILSLLATILLLGGVTL